MTIPWGHFSFADVFVFNGTLPSTALDPQPHCFQRDLNNWAAKQYTNQSDVEHLIYQAANISTFQNVMSGAFGSAALGVHGGGHVTAGPDLFDFFASPSDPSFWLHHGMIDLVWTEWQAQDPTNRKYALSGGSTSFNIPPSANVTVNDFESFGILDKDRQIGTLMSVTDGPYCYRYEY